MGVSFRYKSRREKDPSPSPEFNQDLPYLSTRESLGLPVEDSQPVPKESTEKKVESKLAAPTETAAVQKPVEAPAQVKPVQKVMVTYDKHITQKGLQLKKAA